MNRLGSIIRLYWYLYVLRDPQTMWVRRWYRDQPDQTLRYDYPLSTDSVVFDLGGYEGAWAAEIYRRYRSQVFVFEPVRQFFERICVRFETVPDIHVLDFGLADEGRLMHINLGADGSGAFSSGGSKEQIRLVRMAEFVQTHAIPHIDLIKMNIEGAEYDLLDHMLSAGLVDKCTDIQIQFHRFVPDADARRDEIRKGLMKTHYLTYDYPFVWENWRRRDRV